RDGLTVTIVEKMRHILPFSNRGRMCRVFKLSICLSREVMRSLGSTNAIAGSVHLKTPAAHASARMLWHRSHHAHNAAGGSPSRSVELATYQDACLDCRKAPACSMPMASLN